MYQVDDCGQCWQNCVKTPKEKRRRNRIEFASFGVQISSRLHGQSFQRQVWKTKSGSPLKGWPRGYGAQACESRSNRMLLILLRAGKSERGKMVWSWEQLVLDEMLLEIWCNSLIISIISLALSLPFLLSLFLSFPSLSIWSLSVCLSVSLSCVEILMYNVSLTHSCLYVYKWCL